MATSSVPIPFIDAAGFHMPAFPDVLVAHKADYQSVYGVDVFDSSDQDTQWVTIEAQAIFDTFALALSVYNAFSPATAQGTGLSSVVKVNGITRKVPSYSTADLTVTGQAGTVLTGIVASDGANRWSLPGTVVIPLSGEIVVTATCQMIGAITAGAGTINQIATPTRGLQSIVNAADATPGLPAEQDAALRGRQKASTALAATGVVDGIYGALVALPNVSRARVYENDTNTPDASGIPGHTISAVVDGGDAAAIAAVIAQRKLSSGTYGTASAVVTTGAAQIPRTIAFFRPIAVSVVYRLVVRPLSGYTVDVATAIQRAVSDWTNALGIGCGQDGRIVLSRVYGPALLPRSPFARAFEIVSVSIGRDAVGLAVSVPITPADLPVAFNEAPYCRPSFVTIVPP